MLSFTWLPPPSPGAGCPAYASIRIGKNNVLKRAKNIIPLSRKSGSQGVYVGCNSCTYVFCSNVHSSKRNLEDIQVTCFVKRMKGRSVS